MPDVRMPDGTVIRNVPEGTTKTQLMARYGKARQPKPRNKGFGLPGLDSVLSAGNELLIGAGQGLENIGALLTDPVVSALGGEDALAQERQRRKGRWDTASRALVSQPNPVARTTGQVGVAMASPAPKIKAAGKVAKIANRAIQGAMGGVAVRESDAGALAPAGIGTAASVALPPILSKIAQTRPAQAMGRAASKAVSPLIGAADNAAEAILPGVNRMLGRAELPPLRGMPPQPLSAPLAPLGRKAQARSARFKSLGVDKPTTGMVTRDPAAFSFEQNTAKLHGIGDDLAQQMREAEVALVEKGRSLVRGLGGARGPEATGKAVEDVLDTKRTEMQQVTSRIYERVREARGDEPAGDLKGFRDFLEHPDVVDDATLDVMAESVKRRLARFEGPVTVKQADGLRRFVGKLGNGVDPNVRRLRKELIDALDDEVVNAVGDDAFKAARESAKVRFQEFSKTFAGKLADEKLAPESLTRRILGDGVKLSDLRAVRRSLTTGTPEQVARGESAWRDLQAQAVEELLGESIDQDGNLIGSALSRKFGKSAPKLRELLGPDDFKMLRRLSAATRDVKAFPVGHSVNTSNTAPTLANMFTNAPARVRDGWLKLFGKIGLRAGAHVGATAAAGPVGNFAVEGVRAAGSAAAAQRAEQVAAQAIMDKIRLAQNPEAAAAAIREAQSAAASNPAVADFLNSAGFGRLLGGTAAATAQ